MEKRTGRFSERSQRLKVPAHATTAERIRALPGFGRFASGVRDVRRQTGLPTADVLQAQRNLGLAVYADDQLAELVKALEQPTPAAVRR